LTGYDTAAPLAATIGQPTGPAAMPARGATLHTPSGTWPPPHDPVAANVRNRVVDRLVRMSVRHGVHAWEHRRDRPVAPHAVAFFFTAPEAPDVERVGYDVSAATRMTNDDPSVRDLPRLLFRLSRLAQERYLPTPGGFDPATQMCSHRDLNSGTAVYAGIGVSTLDTPAASWDDIQRQAAGVEDIPGRCYALLADHTALLIDRGPTRTTFGAVTVHSTGDLNLTPGVALRTWIPHADVSSMPAALDVWERLHELHSLTLNQPRRPML
jgi:hypothetical protein